MTINRLLATLEEYLELKREIGKSEDLDELKQASNRVELSLREYIQAYFDLAILEDRRKTSSITSKVDVLSPDKASYSWNDVAKLIDALNSAPIPPKNLDDQEGIENWVSVYREWFKNKKMISIIPAKKNEVLEIDFNDLIKR